MNITGKQWLSIIAAVVSALMLATTQLTDIFGPSVAKTVVSVAALLNLVINSVVAGVTGQGSLVRDVAAMPGVERITVNSSATQALAAVATDATQPKVGATDAGTRIVLQDTAKGTTP
jgi:hypothetical protein